MSDTFDVAAHQAETAASVAAEETSAPPAVQNAAPSDQQAEAPDTSDESTPDDPKDAPETPSRGDKRVQQLLAERHALRERMAYLEGLAQQGNKQPEAPAPQQNQPAALAGDLAQWVGDEPKPEAFPAGEFDPQYLRAIARFEARSEQAQIVQAQRAQAHRQAEQARAEAFFAEAAKAAKEKSDFREVAGVSVSGLPTGKPTSWQCLALR